VWSCRHLSAGRHYLYGRRPSSPERNTSISEEGSESQGNVEADEEASNPNWIVTLAHFSGKDYMISGQGQASGRVTFTTTETDARVFITKTCLLYILYFDRSEAAPKSYQKYERFPMLAYACKYWFDHLNLVPIANREVINPVALRLFLSQSVRSSWLRADNPFDRRRDSYWHSYEHVPLLCFCYRFTACRAVHIEGKCGPQYTITIWQVCPSWGNLI
jgi:hypothetical protein